MNSNSILAEIHDAAQEVTSARAKIVSLASLRQIIAHNRVTVVLTKGTFDILHYGHLNLIAYCVNLKHTFEKTILVVGVEGDASVKARKGPKRPINDEVTRALQIASLPSVDYVVTGEDATPVRLIEALRPAVYVKGQDTAVKQRCAGETILLSLSATNPEIDSLLKCNARLIVLADDGSMSTSDLLKRLRSLETGLGETCEARHVDTDTV